MVLLQAFPYWALLPPFCHNSFPYILTGHFHLSTTILDPMVDHKMNDAQLLSFCVLYIAVMTAPNKSQRWNDWVNVWSYMETTNKITEWSKVKLCRTYHRLHVNSVRQHRHTLRPALCQLREDVNTSTNDIKCQMNCWNTEYIVTSLNERSWVIVRSVSIIICITALLLLLYTVKSLFRFKRQVGNHQLQVQHQTMYILTIWSRVVHTTYSNNWYQHTFELK